MENRPAAETAPRIRRMARLRALAAQVRRLDRRDRYRLYMSMMGAPARMIEGEDWNFILHRMVAGSHNVAAYEKEADRIESDLRKSLGDGDGGIDEWYRRVHDDDPGFLDPVLDLVHRMTAEFYSYAGHPVHGGRRP